MWGVSFQSHQPRLMAGRSWRGSLAEPDLCKCGLQKDFNSNNRGKEKWVETTLHKQTRLQIKPSYHLAAVRPLKGHLSQVCSAACLHLPVCRWVTSLKRYWFTPFLSSDLREHGGWTIAALSEVSISGVCWSLYKCLHSVALPVSQWDGCLHLPAGNRVDVLRPLPSSAGLLYAEAISAHLKTHFWQSNATIKLVNRLRWTDTVSLNSCFVTLDGKTRMRESSYACIFPPK